MLKKLKAAKLVSKLSVLYVTRRFVRVLKRNMHWTLTSATLINVAKQYLMFQNNLIGICKYYICVGSQKLRPAYAHTLRFFIPVTTVEN